MGILRQSVPAVDMLPSDAFPRRAEIAYFHALNLCNGGHPPQLCSPMLPNPFSSQLGFFSFDTSAEAEA